MAITLDRMADLVGGTVVGDGLRSITGAAPFEEAGRDEITFAVRPQFLKRIDQTSAGAVIVPRDVQAPGVNLLQVSNPEAAFARVMALLYRPAKPEAGIHAAAVVGDDFVCGRDVSIAPLCVIQNNVTLGDRVTLHPHVVLGDNVVVGDDTTIYPNVVVLERCRIGRRVTIQAGSVIGSDGFGFAPEGEHYIKIPQTGIVRIDDDVEIGAGNTIDRATFGKTWIQQGVKTDNLVHVAHNVTVGEHTVLVAQVGISGSVTIGRHAILAGQAGLSGHLQLGDNVIVGPQAGVSKSVASGSVVSGSPEMPHRLWLRVQRIIPRLPELKKKIEEVARRLDRIEGQNEPNR